MNGPILFVKALPFEYPGEPAYFRAVVLCGGREVWSRARRESAEQAEAYGRLWVGRLRAIFQGPSPVMPVLEPLELPSLVQAGGGTPPLRRKSRRRAAVQPAGENGNIRKDTGTPRW